MLTAIQRLTHDDALTLFRDADLFTLGIQAEAAKRARHPHGSPVTFVIDRNVSYTNVCNVDCLFCAFYRHKEDEDAYTLTYTQIAQKARELEAIGGTQLLLQGGVNPDLPFQFYLDLLRQLRQDFPALTIHAFSPTEIDFMVTLTGKSLEWVLEQLVEAGMSSIPGGGAEVLHDDVRQKISPKKVNTLDWLVVMEAAHRVGLNTTATMMFGHVEQDWHIIDHLLRIRDLQDRSLAAGKGRFTAFIPWTFQKPHTKLQKLPSQATGTDYLRVLAISRLLLDNIDHIQSSWLTQGEKLCQTGLYFGADDVGGIIMEENVVTEAGIARPEALQAEKRVADMVKLIHATGQSAAQRDTQYNLLKHYPCTNAVSR
jgi:cyclic dehypoxanthinyl futalosine synthase